MLKINVTPLFPMKYIQEPNYDFEFTILEEDRFLTTPYTCKDYMQDVFWSEFSGKSGSVWGLNWKPGQFDVNKDRFRMAVLGGQVSLKDTVKQLQKFINAFDKAQGFNPTKVLETDDEKMIVIDFSSEWATSAPLVSTLTTLVRIAGVYKTGNVEKYLEELHKNGTSDLPNYMHKEHERLESTLPRMKALLNGDKVEYAWNKISSMPLSHNCGIVGYSNYPERE